MLEELLGRLLPPDQVALLFEPAVLDRDFARQALDDRAAAVARLSGQLASGVWHSDEVAGAAAAATNDRLLLRMSCQRYVDAHGGQCDLDIEYHPLLPAGAALTLDDIDTALAFVAAARPADPPELWFAALQDEATAYLHQLRGDVYLVAAQKNLDKLDAALIVLLDPADPYAVQNILVHSASIALFREERLPWRVEAAYRRFLAAFPDDPLAGWHARADVDPDYQDATLNAYYSLVLDVLDALCLHNPSDRTEIERLTAETPPPDFAPALGLYERDVVALPDLAPAVFAAAADALRRIGRALERAKSHPGRPLAVLGAWAAFACRGLSDFAGAAKGLARIKPDDEALGIVVQALRGEAGYRMGRYEDAYLDLLGAEDAARAALGRANGPGERGANWSETERDAVARLAQKAGNALAVIGDEARAGAAYDRVADLASDPLAHAGNLLNQGNRLFLRNSAVGAQGYITLDAEARQEFALRGGERLIASVVGRHVACLFGAEAAYQGALDAANDAGPVAPGAETLAATAEIDLGNVCWAWGQTLVTEGVNQLGGLPLGPDFASKLLAPESDARSCYEAAVAQYEAGLKRLGASEAGAEGALPVPAAQLPLVATALSSLSEMRYLVAREHLRGGAALDSTIPRLALSSSGAESLAAGIAEARRCLALMGQEAAALYPDLVWRAHYNLARMFRLLGKPAKAARHFRQAIRQVERLRAELRLDSFQSAFLHDKADVYEGYIDLLLEQGADQNLPQIFALFERSRARAFLTLLQAAEVKTRLPARLKSSVEALLADISACNEAIQAAVAGDDRTKTEALLAQQRELARRWADMQSRMARGQRRAHRVPPLAPLSGFQAALGDDQGFLGLLMGSEASFLLLIDRATARVFRLPPRRALELLALPVLAYATWSNAETGAAFRTANVALTRALLGTFDADGGFKAWLQSSPQPGMPGKHLLVSPDGILCYLPFEALLADTVGVAALPDTADYPDFAPFYLLSLADISYAPSASAWIELGRRKREPSAAALMAVYNVLYDTPEPPQWAVAENIMLKLGAITSGPDMKRLTEAVMKVWGENAAVVRLRSRTDEGAEEAAANQSTERNFLRVAPDARPRILLFHGHGIYNDRYPSLSGLVFNLAAPPDQAKRAAIPTSEDGFLRVEELFQLALPGVELTFLAACQTALGGYRRGEGLSALVRAFLYRGSPAVSATLWEVRADMTAFLLRVFFRLLSEQPGADRARLFSQARRKAMPYVANLYLPYFWAPYVLWGQTGPVVE